MKSPKLIAGSLIALATVALTPAAAGATPAPGYRQLIGTVSTTTYLEASTPAAGTYALEYDITGLAFFDTYVDGTELGYVGVPDGAYRTRAVPLRPGGHLIEAVGPEGSGTARVYLVQTS